MEIYCYYWILCMSLFLSTQPLIGQNRPNIVLIIADDLGWGDVSLHGSQQVKTPNIDVLASNGIILNNYYVSPICSPSRSALLTGYHPIHTGLQHDVIYGSEPWGLPVNYKILPKYLKELGYETHAVGKWHQGFFESEYLPTKRGFDSHFGYWTGHEDYYDRIAAENWWGIDFRNNESPVPLTQYQGLYSTHIYTNKSVDIILNKSRNSSKPLFLYLAQQSVHAGNGRQPLQVPQEYIDRFKHIKDIRRRTFAAMVSALDDSVGEVFSALQKAYILNDTIVIFSTDNGAAVGNNAGGGIDSSIGSNWPLRGAKYTLFEGGIRGFGFIWSALLKNQYTSDHLMHIQDWLPTIYSAIGANIKDLGPIDGIDFWNVLNNKLKSPRKQLLHNIDDIWNVWALRDGDYKLIYGSTLGGQYDGWFLPPGEAINSSQQEVDYNTCKVYNVLKQMNFNEKTIQKIETNCDSSVKNDCKPTENPCLFNVRLDPCEYNNIFNEKPNIVKDMLKQLSIYNSSAVKPGNQPTDPNANPVLHDYRWDIFV